MTKKQTRKKLFILQTNKANKSQENIHIKTKLWHYIFLPDSKHSIQHYIRSKI